MPTATAPRIHQHSFDSLSGWCGCGYRDDGRLTNKAGDIYRTGPEYTPEQLETIRQSARQRETA